MKTEAVPSELLLGAQVPELRGSGCQVVVREGLLEEAAGSLSPLGNCQEEQLSFRVFSILGFHRSAPLEKWFLGVGGQRTVTIIFFKA